MCRKYPHILLLIYGMFVLIASVDSQQSVEFEGVINYSHKVTPFIEGYDVKPDYDYMGQQSIFYYKKGKYKWLNENAFIEMEIFRSRDSVQFLKMKPTDTIMCLKNNATTEVITNYMISRNADTVAGYTCNVLEITAKVNGSEWTRKYSYTEELSIDAAFFANYKDNSFNQIYALMNALPLKIEIIYKDRKITYTAVSVEKKSLPDNLFEFSPETKFKNLVVQAYNNHIILIGKKK